MKVYVVIREEWDCQAGAYNDIYRTIKGVFTNKDGADEALRQLSHIDSYQEKEDYIDRGVTYYIEDYETDKIIDED